MHFYPGYTAETALAIPWSRFLALVDAIPALQAEDDMRAVMVAAYGANPGEKGRQLRSFTESLSKAAGRRSKPEELPTLIPGITPGVLAEAEPGAIEAERERQRQAAERIEAEHRTAWEAQRRGQGGA